MGITIKKNSASEEVATPQDTTKKVIKPKAKPAPAPLPDDTPEVEAPAPTAVLKKNHTVTATIEKQHSDGSSEEIKEDLGKVQVARAPAEVSLSVGITRNLGNYESMKFNVHLMIPCEPTAEEIEATYASVKEWVDGKASQINAEITEQIG